MSKLSRSTRTVIIAAAVLLVLGIVFLVLMLTEPKEEGSSSTPDSSSSTGASVSITDKEGIDIITAEITNEHGSYTFTRDKRTVSRTDEEGNVISTDEFYWKSDDLAGVTPNDTTIKAFMNCLASIDASDTVEEDAQELDKYGLENPVATAKVTFEDGTSAVVHFGIRNPADTSDVYCRTEGSSTVYLSSYYSVANVYNAISDFVNLTFTKAYDANDPQELNYFIIERKDLEENIEISFMYDIQEEAEDEDSVITTFNSHRVTSPLVAEVDSTKGRTVCYGLYGLSAASCVYVDATDAQLEETGLSDPFCTITFKYGGDRKVIRFGNKIITETESDDESTPTLTTVTGYYGMIEGSNAVYAFATDSVPWYTVQLQDIVSRRPVSPYIYTVDTLVITTPDKEYKFIVQGDAKDNSFTIDGQELDGDKFRQLYQHLITAVGDELYLTEGDYEPYITVKFNYREEYHELYGTDSDTLEYFRSDDRKNIIRVNGKVLFKVRQVYTERLLENIEALLNGGDIRLDW
ncbi:MAG: DUF4340 domain-containing protein [Oscillospiraceae bacterium]|nr:DUF4340 domain-containing protein [Oscillospiraceae bacterium]